MFASPKLHFQLLFGGIWSLCTSRFNHVGFFEPPRVNNMIREKTEHKGLQCYNDMAVDANSELAVVVQFHRPAALIHYRCNHDIANQRKIQRLKKNLIGLKYSDIVKKYNEHMGVVVLFDMLIDGDVGQLNRVSDVELMIERLLAPSSMPHWDCFVVLLAMMYLANLPLPGENTTAVKLFVVSEIDLYKKDFCRGRWELQIRGF